MNDHQFRELLDYFNFSWQGYRKVRKGVKKRIARHMQETRCGGIDAYIELLKTNPKRRAECECHLTVSISRFFRDQKLWQVLKEKILPVFLEKKKLNVWSAGCAGGEEVYSFKIIWKELTRRRPILPMLLMVATDINQNNLARSQTGAYTLSSLKGVGIGCLDRHFDKKQNREIFSIKPHLKDGIVWKQNNLLMDPPPKDHFDIIFLRNNVLTYSKDPPKQHASEKITASLSSSGVLIIGSQAKLPEIENNLVPFGLPYVFIKCL